MALTVEYLSGQNNLAVGEHEEVYIYPQNAEGVSKEYVDQLDELNVKLNSPNNVTTGFRIKNNGRTLISTGTEGVLKLYHVNDPTENEHAANKKYVDDSIDALSFTGDYLPTTGGDLTGQLNTNSLIKSTRNTGYALQVKPDGNEVAHIHTNGNAAFKDVTLKGNINMEGHVFTKVRSVSIKQTEARYFKFTQQAEIVIQRTSTHTTTEHLRSVCRKGKRKAHTKQFCMHSAKKTLLEALPIQSQFN